VEELYGTRYQSGSFPLINVGSGFHCLLIFFIFFFVPKHLLGGCCALVTVIQKYIESGHHPFFKYSSLICRLPPFTSSVHSVHLALQPTCHNDTKPQTSAFAGCTLASAIAAELSKGKPLLEAVGAASQYLHAALW